jgi:hypothetical protein
MIYDNGIDENAALRMMGKILLILIIMTDLVDFLLPFVHEGTSGVTVANGCFDGGVRTNHDFWDEESSVNVFTSLLAEERESNTVELSRSFLLGLDSSPTDCNALTAVEVFTL